eukprot:g63961.t1
MIFLFLFLNESVNINRLSNSSLLLFPLTEVEDHWQLMLPVGGRRPAYCYSWKVKNFSLGKVTEVDVDGDDPNVDSVVLVNVWGHPSGSNQYTGKYLPAWLHGREEKQSINDPSTENKEFKAWEKDVLASHIISLDICMQPSGESEVSSLQIASTDQEHINKDLTRTI